MKLSGEQLESLYTTMVKIRRFDERTAELFIEGLVKGTAHSYVGEEAVAAAACANLREDDYIVGTHRGHGHCIAKGARVKRRWAVPQPPRKILRTSGERSSSADAPSTMVRPDSST